MWVLSSAEAAAAAAAAATTPPKPRAHTVPTAQAVQESSNSRFTLDGFLSPVVGTGLQSWQVLLLL
jgi:hypothetical protein